MRYCELLDREWFVLDNENPEDLSEMDAVIELKSAVESEIDRVENHNTEA